MFFPSDIKFELGYYLNFEDSRHYILAFKIEENKFWRQKAKYVLGIEYSLFDENIKDSHQNRYLQLLAQKCRKLPSWLDIPVECKNLWLLEDYYEALALKGDISFIKRDGTIKAKYIKAIIKGLARGNHIQKLNNFLKFHYSELEKYLDFPDNEYKRFNLKDGPEYYALYGAILENNQDLIKHLENSYKSKIRIDLCHLEVAFEKGNSGYVKNYLQENITLFNNGEMSLDNLANFSFWLENKMMIVCQFGNIDILEMILTEYSGFLSHLDEYLMIACKYGHLEMVNHLITKYLISNPQNVKEVEIIRYLVISTKYGHLYISKFLCNYIPKN